MAYPVVPDVPPFGGVKSQVLQNAATGTSNGTDFSVSGYATLVLLVKPDSSYTGTVTFNASPDGTTFTTIRGAKQTDGTLATSVVCSSGTATIWTFQLAGITAFRASIAGDNTNTVTVTGFVSNEPNLTPLAATITSTVLGTGSNTIGAANIVDSAGTNLAGVDASHNVLVKVNAALPAGTNLIGGANIIDSAGTNKVGVDAQHAMQVSDGGTATVVITASSAGAVKASAGRLCRVLTTSAATAAVNIYDNTNAASGTIIATVPASTAVGTVFNVQAPAANGIYVGGGAGTPGLTVFYS